MSESVSLPALGESVTEGTVTRWLKNVGDQVEVDEPLLEVSTDKVDTEIPSPVAGVIEKILVAEDETVEVGTDLVTIGDGSGAEGGSGGQEAPAEEAPAAEPAQEAEQEAQQPAEQEEAPESEEQKAPEQQPQAEETQEAAVEAATTPSAESESPEPAREESPEGSPAQPEPAEEAAPKEAPADEDESAEPQAEPAQPKAEPAEPQAEKEEKAPADSEDRRAEAGPAPAAEQAEPSGRRAAAGYVTPIVRKLAHEQGIDLSSLTGSGVGGRIRKQDVLAAAAGSAGAPAPEPEISPLRGTTQPMSRLRKVIADRAVTSMQTSAQLTSVVEVDVTAIAELRARSKDDFLEKTGTKLSFLPFFVLAAAEALKSYPVVNAVVDGDSIVYPDHEHVSIAVDTERGLLTPVVRDASTLNIREIALEVADLADRTRENKLKPDELAGGTFTVTNTGSRGALFDTPIVFLPQVAILGTGAVVKRPVVVAADGGDAIAVRSMVYLTLSYDHRIVDGADAARFLVAVKSRLEEGNFQSQLGL